MRAVRASCSSAALLLLHLPLLSKPYFWDEVGQFIPASLDIFYSGELIPRSTIPNVHPPGVMLWLAAAWRIFGCSIVTTRAAMLLIAALACWWVYRLAADFLCPEPGAPGMTLVLLCLSPLFFSQSMMALLDLPAMALTALALLLFFRERLVLAVVACAALVIVKESGVLLPAALAIVLARESRWKHASLFLLPAIPLAAWLLFLHAQTGQWFGNAPFARYNLTYSLNLVRLAMAVFRRGYYLFIGTGYVVGTAALLVVRRGFRASREWRVVILFAATHFAVMCIVGGAVLERYLLPILPITLAAFSSALACLKTSWRIAGFAAMCAISAVCIVINPVYPFPLENNLAWTDYVDVQLDAAKYLSTHLRAHAVIATTFPFAGCLRRPELGYTTQSFRLEEIASFTRESVEPLRGRHVDAFALFSSTWDPLGLMHNPHWVAFLEKFYNYQPDVTAGELHALLGLHRVARFQRHGQWIELFQP